MKEYRVYLLTFAGQVLQTVDLICADDDAAVELAKKLLDDSAVELWDGPRRIARFTPKH
jgi:hypothetical protein